MEQSKTLQDINGFMGKLLFVDLGSGEIEERPLDEAVAKNYLGGPGLGAKILYDEMPGKTDIYAPESMIGFVSGVLNETGSFLGGRYTVVSKSPVTNGWNDANSGGMFGPMLKRSGYDAVFVKGISEKPVYIYINEGKAEIRDASALWGKPVTEVEKALFAELGDKVVIAQTGIGGERKSAMAAIMNNGHRAAGRGGSGAVMGSKNLKAVVVYGSQKPTIADKDAQSEINKQISDWQKNGPVQGLVGGFKELGTTLFYEPSAYNGDLSIRNWAGANNELTEEQIKEPMTQERFKKKKYACSACPIGCGAIFSIDEEGVDIEHGGRPEYETMGMFGSQMMNSDAMTINVCNNLCNEYGLDTISLGATVAWAMECYNDGTLSKEELDGVELTWGNKDAIIEMTEKICKGEGVGEILQHGSRFAANHFGKGHHARSDASGIEIPQHDPRFSPGLARTYQYDPTPGRHTKGGLTPQYGNKPPEIKYNYDNTAVDDVNGVVFQEIANSGGYCQFAEFGFPEGAHMGLISAVTGFDYTDEERRRLGLRMYILRHAFNLREGFRRDYWTIADRIIGEPPLEEGPLAGVTVDAKKLADNFFTEIGFDQDGVPLKGTLEEVGDLENVIRDLYE